MAIFWIVGCLFVAVWIVLAGQRRQERRDQAATPQQEHFELPPIGLTMETEFTTFDNPIAVPGKISFVQDVVGEKGKNWDGTHRQEILKHSVIGDPIELVPEPDNEDDPFAVKVMHRYGQVGYIPSRRARAVLSMIKKGRLISCKVHRIGGGTPAKPSRGLWLHIVAEPGPRSKKD